MYAIGVDIGGMSMKIGLVNEKGKVLDTEIVPTNPLDNYKVTINDLCAGINRLVERNKLYHDDVNGIGIGVPGAINQRTKCVDSSANLHWENVPLVQLVEEGCKIPVKMTNDANAATLGEARFGFKGKYPNVVMLTLGTGIGGGVIIEGQLFEGVEGKGTELGHTSLIIGGRPCNCGRRGCAEAYASATALMNLTKEAMDEDKDSILWKMCDGDKNKVNGKMPFDAAKEGDKAGMKVVDDYIMYLGETILNLNNIFRPNAFILSGGVAKQGEYLINRLKEYCARYDWGYKNTPVPELLIATLGYESGIIGAASLCL